MPVKRRAKNKKPALVVRVPQDVLDKLDREAERQTKKHPIRGVIVTRSDVLRYALENFDFDKE